MCDYKWSSHPLYVKGKTINERIAINSMLAYFSDKKKEAIKAYKEFMDIEIKDDVLKFYLKKFRSTILGDSEFKDMIKRRFIKDEKSLI